MKNILFIHPLGQTFAFIFGFFNLLTGYTRKCFNIAIHINCGSLYYFVTLLGAGIGVSITKWAKTQNILFDMDFHEICALFFILFAAIGLTTGIIMIAQIEKRKLLIKYHRWVNTLGIIFFVLQGISGFIALFNTLDLYN